MVDRAVSPCRTKLFATRKVSGLWPTTCKDLESNTISGFGPANHYYYKIPAQNIKKFPCFDIEVGQLFGSDPELGKISWFRNFQKFKASHKFGVLIRNSELSIYIFCHMTLNLTLEKAFKKTQRPFWVFRGVCEVLEKRYVCFVNNYENVCQFLKVLFIQCNSDICWVNSVIFSSSELHTELFAFLLFVPWENFRALGQTL